MDKAEAFELLMAFVKNVVAEGEEWSADPDYFNSDNFASGVVEDAGELLKRIQQ